MNTTKGKHSMRKRKQSLTPHRSVQALESQIDGGSSFFGGMAHILDLGNTLIPPYQVPLDIDLDRLAFLLDWYVLTRDAQKAWSMTVQEYE